MNARVKTIALGVLAATSVAIAAAQQPQPPQQPVFRAGVDLVTVDVTVVDKDGTPVRGLKPEDFVVTLQGQPRPVRALDFLEFGSSSGSDVSAPTRQATNQPAPNAPTKRGGRTIVILFDDLSYRPGPGKLLLISAERMLATFDPADLIGITTTSGLGPVVNPTRDRAALRSALTNKQIVGRYDDVAAPFYIGIDEALQIERGIPRDTLAKVITRECAIEMPGPDGFGDTEVCPHVVEAAARRLANTSLHRTAMQMEAYRQIMTLLSRAPAPRVVIALSSGVPVSAAHGELQRQLEPLARAAGETGVEFYALSEVPDAIDMRDRDPPSPDVPNRAQARTSEGRFLNAGIQTVATAAGGEAFVVVGQADRFYKRIEAETSAFYRLGVEAPVSEKPDRFLNAKVSVRAPGVTVRTHARAVVASAAAEPLSVDDRLRTALAQGGESFGVPIALGVALRRDPADAAHVQMGANVQVPASASGPLTAMFAILDSEGRVIQQGRATMTRPLPAQDFQLALPLGVEPAAYKLRIAVADASGNVGSLEHTVSATLTYVGTLGVSDLLLTWQAAEGAQHFLALDTLPTGASTLRVALELYPTDAATPRDLTVRLTLVRVGKEEPVVESDLTPSSGANGTLSIAASIPTHLLEPGNYAIRATILESGAVVGMVSTTVRKSGGL